MACGYSLGEVAALIAGGVYDMDAILTPLLILAGDVAKLAKNIRMGVLFSRGPALDFNLIRRLCARITNRGHGTIAISRPAVFAAGPRRMI